MLRVTRRAMRNWDHAGTLRAIRLPGGGRRYRRDDVLRILGEVK
jgi:predicted site-specific integrase-resolvase